MIGDAGEFDARAFEMGERYAVVGTNDEQAGQNLMGGGVQQAQHAAGIVGVFRFGENLFAGQDHGIRGDDDGRSAVSQCAPGYGMGFGLGDARDVGFDGFAGCERLVDVRGLNGEVETRVAQDLGATGRGGGEDKFHACLPVGVGMV